MRIIICSLAVLMSIVASSQVQKFTPNWKVGDTKKSVTTSIHNSFSGKTIISTDTAYSELTVKVNKVTPTEVLLDITMENPVVAEICNVLGEYKPQLSAYKNLKLSFQMERTYYSMSLKNASEVKMSMDKSIVEVKRVTQKEDPEVREMIDQLAIFYQAVFETKESIESLVLSDLNFLMLPYSYEFEVGKPIEYTVEAPSPIDERLLTSEKVVITMLSFDAAKKQAVFSEKTLWEKGELSRLFRMSFKQMLEQSGSATPADLKMVEQMAYDIQYSKRFYYDTATTWVTKVVTSEITDIVNPLEGNSHEEVTVTREVR